MTIKFLNTPAYIAQTKLPNDLLKDFIDPGLYSLGWNEDIPGNFFLKPMEVFEIPPKIYGNNNNYSEVILEEFLNTPNAITSAALTGIKGSGKSLTAKQISIEGLKRGIPTILISEPFSGSAFNSWISNISQPVILIVDEFEKVYREENKRDPLLTFLDGTYKTHKLFIMTMNKDLKEFEYFYNRPGRVKFNINYEGMTEEVIKEYCEDNLKDKTKLSEILRFSKTFKDMTLDILSILVAKVNSFHNLSCKEVIEILNIHPTTDVKSYTFNVIVKFKGNKLNTSYNTDFKKPFQTYIPFNFVSSILSGHTTNLEFSLPLAEEIPENSFNSYSTKKEEDSSVTEDIKIFYHSNLSLKEFNHSQNEESRVVYLKHKQIRDLEIEIIPENLHRAPLKYSF